MVIETPEYESQNNTDTCRENLKAKNMVFLCRKDGLITGVIDDTGASGDICAGEWFTEVIDQGHRQRASEFLQRISREKLVPDVEMALDRGQKKEMLLYTGIELSDRVLIIATDTYNDFGRLLEEMSGISNEQTNIVRELARQKEKVADIERKKIERDLHDSISQTIFSARIISELIPDLWEKDREEARRQMEKLKVLTRESLIEMRRLFRELRPGSFAEERIEDLLRQLVNSFRLRSNIDIVLKLKGKADLSEEVKKSIYRIAQESLNNAIKHSGADHIDVVLDSRYGQAILSITDNGCGFEIDKVPSKKLGLYIMDQRAGSIRADLDITSKKGNGTSVSLTYKKEQGEK